MFVVHRQAVAVQKKTAVSGQSHWVVSLAVLAMSMQLARTRARARAKGAVD